MTEIANRTRLFARIIGPALVLIPSIIAIRAPAMDELLADFFANQALVWITGAVLVFAGLTVIALHQIWSSVSAVLVSLFGWFLLLRGILLLVVPQIAQSNGAAVAAQAYLVQLIFAGLIVIGLWLSYTGWLDQPEP